MDLLVESQEIPYVLEILGENHRHALYDGAIGELLAFSHRDLPLAGDDAAGIQRHYPHEFVVVVACVVL